MISVVIPFYQRQSGILQRALRSAMSQQSVDAMEVIVVDDSSPVAAEQELHALGGTPRFPVRIISQPNAGPGAARNRGLANVNAGTRYVAFLDSDDEWSANHIQRAAQALSQGYHFYFSDLYHLGQTVGAFARAGRIEPDEHPRLRGEDLHAYAGDMFTQIIVGNVIGTSTVVYDFEKFGEIRFRDDLRSAGEDYLCWMEFASRGAKFAFSSRAEAKYGAGVNVYSGSGWGTDEHLLRVHEEYKYKKLTGKLYPLTPEQRVAVRQKMKELRLAFARDVLHRIRRRHAVPLDLLTAQIAMDPRTLLAIPYVAIYALLSRTG